MKKEYIKYETFLEKCNLITLREQKKVKEKYDEAVIKTSNIIDEITDLPNETKTWIVNSIYENNRKTVGLAGRLTEELGVPKETAEKIYESIDKKIKKEVFQHYGKVPQEGWTDDVEGYTGFDDENYGTAFQCHYIEQLGLFFVVIDIDAHNPDTDIPIDTMESCMPEEYRDTRVIKTGSGGKHYYYLSKEPPIESVDSNINIDYQTIRAGNVEEKIDGTYKNKKKGAYVVASYRWSYDGNKKEEYVHDKTSNNNILVVENTDIIIQSIKNNLISKGFIEKEDVVKKDTTDKTTVKKVFTLPIKEENDKGILTEETGIQLITRNVEKIIRKTEGHHNNVLLALEGGLEHIGFKKDIRLKILMDALEKANDLTEEHEKQINHSLNNKGRKRGFRYLRRTYNEIIDEIERIFLLKQIYWKSISEKDYELIKIHYMELISALFKIISKEEDKKMTVLYIDSYFNMCGISLNERLKLIEEVKKYGVTDLKDTIVTRTKKYTTHTLIKKGQINLDADLYKKYLKEMKKNKEHEYYELNNLVKELDMQVSITKIRNKTPNIQPLINLVDWPGLPEYKRRQNAYKYLKENENLKKTKDGNYIFDDQIKNSYVPVDSNKLGDFLTRKYPILEKGIESTELDKILNLSGEFDELHNEYYIFNNGVFDVHERSFIETKDFMDYFSIRKMDCNLKLEKTVPQIVDSPHCLVDRVLREILVPNYKEGKKGLDYGYYFDFLQRLGSAFNTRIKEKKFACYYGKGDNGKDILIEILKMAFGDRCLLATMDILQDEKADLSEYDVVIIDELDKHSFKDAIAFIKRITGGEEEGTAKRRLYQHDIFKPKNPSAFFLFTNEIPAVPLTDTAFYRREDALELQNHFTENPNTKKDNEFQADSSLKDKIKNSKEDNLEWLINAGINAYYGRYDKNGYFKGFTKAQTADETKMIVSSTDPLSKFLRETYVEDKNKISKISNREIIISYKNYCQLHKLTVSGNISPITMGNAIKNVFGDIKKPNSKDTLYFLEVKKEDDNAITYYIDSTYDWWNKKDEIPEDTYDSHEQIYNQIKLLDTQCLAATKGQLKEQFGHLDVEEILTNLVNSKLIFEGRK